MREKVKLIIIFIMFLIEINSFSIQKPLKNLTQSEKIEFNEIRDRWKKKLMETDTKDDKLEIIKKSEKFYKKLDKINWDEIKTGEEVAKVYENIKNLSKGYCLPNLKYYKNPKIKNKIINMLDLMHTYAYNKKTKEEGNWWYWEIGIPKILNDIITLMYDDISLEKREKYLKISEYFQPFAKYSGASPSAKNSTSPKKRVSTGGNRADTSMICFLRGILLEDKNQVMDGLNSVVEVGEYVTQKDGFYKDGSFIQHTNVPYNGTYACVLFEGLGNILYLTKGTNFEIKDKRIENIYENILNGYSYLFINSGINDSVSGRAISRDNTSDITRGENLLNAIAFLCLGANEPYQTKLKSLIKSVISENKNYIPKNKIIKEIMENKNINFQKIQGSKIYGAMDRAVLKNSKGGKIVLAMHSSRISNYETMNGENIKGWYTSDGMTYIYGNDLKTYTDFWSTVDKYHLSGVTNSQNIRKNGSGEKVSSKYWVGGSGNGQESFIGMDMISWNEKTKIKKSYFMTEDGILLVVGAGLESSDGEIHTTIDNRIINEGKIYLNGKEIKENIKIENPKNLSINFNDNFRGENIGYKIIYGDQINIEKESRKGSWKDIGGRSQKEISKNYFKVYMNHGKNPKNKRFAYVVLPMFSKEEVEDFDTSRFVMIKLDKNIHMIKDKKNNVVGINFWKNGEIKGIKTYSPLSFLIKQNKKFKELWISDPTQISKEKVKFEINGKYELLESSTEKIDIEYKNGKTIIKIDLQNNGSSEYIKLKKY